VRRLRELGAGGELAVKALQKDLVKAARKAMQEQVGRGRVPFPALTVALPHNFSPKPSLTADILLMTMFLGSCE